MLNGGFDFLKRAHFGQSFYQSKLRHAMAHIRKDTLSKTVQWWKHLRPFWKRRQQRRERVAAAKLIRAELYEQMNRAKN